MLRKKINKKISIQKPRFSCNLLDYVKKNLELSLTQRARNLRNHELKSGILLQKFWYGSTLIAFYKS